MFSVEEANQRLGDVVINLNNNTYFDSGVIKSGFYDLEIESVG